MVLTVVGAVSAVIATIGVIAFARHHRFRLGFFALLAGLVAAVLFALLPGIQQLSSSSSSAALTAAQKSEVTQLLTVSTVTEHCATTGSDNLTKVDIAALKGTPPRAQSDSLSTPLSGGLDGVESADCTDPLYGATVANMLANWNVDGVSVLSLNPWLKPFAGDASGINDEAAKFVPLMDVAHPSDAQTQLAITRNHAWQAVADRENTLLTRLHVAGYNTLPSVKNWHLVAGGLKVGGLPEVGLDARTDVKKALVLEVTLKNACAPVARIGFNTTDKRPEVFSTPVCEQSVAAGPTPSSSTPTQSGSTPSGGTPTTPGTPSCQSNCATTPACQHNCQTTPSCQSNCSTTPSCTSNCATTPASGCPQKCGQVTVPVQESGEPTVAASGAPSTRPSTNPVGPSPQPSSPAPTSTPGGYNAGGGSGSGPGGSDCSNGVCTGGGQPSPSAPASTPTPVASDPPNSGDPGL